MAFMDRFKLERLQRFSGKHTTRIMIPTTVQGDERPVLVDWTFNGKDNLFDLDYVRFEGATDDVWDTFGKIQMSMVKDEIINQIAEWGESVGIKDYHKTCRWRWGEPNRYSF